jgi:hypothetical protein
MSKLNNRELEFYSANDEFVSKKTKIKVKKNTKNNKKSNIYNKKQDHNESN